MFSDDAEFGRKAATLQQPGATLPIRVDVCMSVCLSVSLCSSVEVPAQRVGSLYLRGLGPVDNRLQRRLDSSEFTKKLFSDEVFSHAKRVQLT